MSRRIRPGKDRHYSSSFLLVCLLTFISPLLALPYSGSAYVQAAIVVRVVRVIDGDTIHKLVSGKTVRLELDVQRRDKFGRILAYVYLKDGTFVNSWLVEHGYAMVMTVPPNVKHQGLFLRLQREAREAKQGLWK